MRERRQAGYVDDIEAGWQAADIWWVSQSETELNLKKLR